MQPTTSENDIPPALAALAAQVGKLGWEAAKRLVVSKVGSVRPGDRFAEDVADAVFLRLQRNAQVGRYAPESEVFNLGRDARRLSGDDLITLYRAAPKGAGIRPGDFVADTAAEAGFYRHGGNVVQSIKVSRNTVIEVRGSSGGDREFVYLPPGYVPPPPMEWFADFKSFFEAARACAPENQGHRKPLKPMADPEENAPAFRMR